MSNAGFLESEKRSTALGSQELRCESYVKPLRYSAPVSE